MRISDWSSDVCSSDLDFAPVKSWRNQKGSKNNERREKVKVCFQMLFQQLCANFNVAGIMAVPVTSIVSLANQARYTRSEEHTSELQSLMRSSYTVFCLKKKTKKPITNHLVSTFHHK